MIFVILNGVRYAQIKQTNDKTSDKNTPTLKQMTKLYEQQFSLSISLIFACFCSFFYLRLFVTLSSIEYSYLTLI